MAEPTAIAKILRLPESISPFPTVCVVVSPFVSLTVYALFLTLRGAHGAWLQAEIEITLTESVSRDAKVRTRFIGTSESVPGNALFYRKVYTTDFHVLGVNVTEI